MFKRNEQVLAKIYGKWVLASYLGRRGQFHYVEFFNERLMQIDVGEVTKVRRVSL